MAYFRPPKPAGGRIVAPQSTPEPIASRVTAHRAPRIVHAGNVIEVTNLTKRFGSKTVVRGLSFSVPPRTLFGFLGPNGAGKSTTMYMLLGLVRPTSGKIRLFGQSVRSREARQRVGALIETPAFYDYLSGRKNLEILGRLTGTASRGEIDEALDLVGLLERGKEKVAVYSDGMRQRLGLAQALLHKPDLLILDEPTNGLDPEGNRDLWLLLRRLVDEEGITALVSSHLLAEVEEYCDLVCVINEGHQIAADKVSNLLTFPTTLLDLIFPDAQIRDAAARCFERADWVRVVEGPPSASDLTLRVEVDRPAAELSRLLRQNVIDIDGMVPVRRTLKEFFLAKTGRRENGGESRSVQSIKVAGAE